jgi:hypothetical protein
MSFDNFFTFVPLSFGLEKLSAKYFWLRKFIQLNLSGILILTIDGLIFCVIFPSTVMFGTHSFLTVLLFF